MVALGEKGRFTERIEPLSKNERSRYRHTIYEEAGTATLRLALIASYHALSDANFPFAIDIEGSRHNQVVSIKSATSDRQGQAVESALVLGLTEATRKKMFGDPETNIDSEKAYDIARGILSDFDEEVYESFKEFYGGLRWRTDQEKFVRALFVHAATFEPEFLDEHLTGGQVSSIVYDLNLGIDYDQRKGWYEMQPSEIFAIYPELDYTRLQDREFADTEEGQKLKKAYTKVGGEIRAQQYDRVERIVTTDGREASRPQIPLSHYPIVEALTSVEVSTDEPRRKYFFGPAEMGDIVIDSDSPDAHEALIKSVNTRLPQDRRRVFDGPTEFQYKGSTVSRILRKYHEAVGDDEHRALLKQDILGLMDGFIGLGSIASSVRQEYQLLRDKTWDSDLNEVKDITRYMLTAGIAAVDPEITGKTLSIIDTYLSQSNLPARRDDPSVADPLRLERPDLMLALFDSLDLISVKSDPAVFERVALSIFGDVSAAAQFREMANLLIQAKKMGQEPETLQAFAKWRKLTNSSLGKETSEKIQARNHYDELMEPSDQIEERVIEERNALLLGFIEQMINAGVSFDNNPAASQLFEGLIKRIRFSSYKIRELPDACHDLMILAKNPSMPDKQKGTILWHIAQAFGHASDETRHLLVPMVIDMYEAVLGPLDAIRQPGEETSHALAAVVHLVSENRSIFKGAQLSELEILAQYRDAVMAKAEQLIGGKSISGVSDSQELLSMRQSKIQEGLGLEDYAQTIRNFKSVLRQLDSIDNYYREFMHIQEVKRKPHVYYPWVLEQFSEFWRSMQSEVERGNSPSYELRDLYSVMRRHVEKFVIQDEYPENFDVLREGFLGSLLFEAYNRMVVYSQLHYNNTVWQKGIPFFNIAISYMPESLKDQLIQIYDGTPFADHVKQLYSRRNPHEEVI